MNGWSTSCQIVEAWSGLGQANRSSENKKCGFVQLGEAKVDVKRAVRLHNQPKTRETWIMGITLVCADSCLAFMAFKTMNCPSGPMCAASCDVGLDAALSAGWHTCSN
jgi:hypothetical protein